MFFCVFCCFKKTSCCPCCLLFLNDCAAPEVEFRRKRYAVHFMFGFVLEGNFLVGYDGAGEELTFDVYPRVFGHKELMQIPGEPFFIEWVGLEVPSFPVILLASYGARE